MVALTELLAYMNDLLRVDVFNDYCPNGLQVEGRPEVSCVVSGVTASQALVDAAVEAGADLVLVHHGYFWRGEEPRVVGVKRRRLKALLTHDISLVAYHLPLDAHPDLGNNAGFGRALGLPASGRFGPDGLCWYAELAEPVLASALAERIDTALGRAPLHIVAADRPLRRVGWCTGAAQGYIEQAACLGLDAYISGEVSEPTYHIARETGVHYFAAGHHATERFGVRALGEHLEQQFGLEHTFIDLPNPV